MIESWCQADIWSPVFVLTTLTDWLSGLGLAMMPYFDHLKWSISWTDGMSLLVQAFLFLVSQPFNMYLFFWSVSTFIYTMSYFTVFLINYFVDSVCTVISKGILSHPRRHVGMWVGDQNYGEGTLVKHSLVDKALPKDIFTIRSIEAST